MVAIITDHLSCNCIQSVFSDTFCDSWMQEMLAWNLSLYHRLCVCAAFHPGLGDFTAGGIAGLVVEGEGAVVMLVLSVLAIALSNLCLSPFEVGVGALEETSPSGGGLCV